MLDGSVAKLVPNMVFLSFRVVEGSIDDDSTRQLLIPPLQETAAAVRTKLRWDCIKETGGCSQNTKVSVQTSVSTMVTTTTMSHFYER